MTARAIGDHWAIRAHAMHIVTYKRRAAVDTHERDTHERDTLELARHALTECGAAVKVTRIRRNANGDRHVISLELIYIRQNGDIGALNLAPALIEFGWMSPARGSEGRQVVFGGGGTDPLDGTVRILARALDIADHGKIRTV